MADRARDGFAPGRFARVIAAIVLCVQVVPVGLPAVAGFAHELYHVSERLSFDYLLEPRVHTAAGAHGEGHGHAHVEAHDSPDTTHDSPGHTHDSPRPTHRAHTHGPSPQSGSHEHVPAVDALLTVAGGNGGSEIAPPPSPERALDLHLPASPAFVHLVDPRPGLDRAPRRALTPLFTPALDPPPPRV